MMHISDGINQEILDDDQCWKAVKARDVRADGTFVTAVRSTGIYCRPSCPARHPHRENVVFYRFPQEAVDAGYRACRRCHPDQVFVPPVQADLIEQICGYIETHLDGQLHLSDLSEQFHLSPYHLQRTFKRIKGVSPRQYAELCRLGSFKARLQEGDSVTDALYTAGYQSSSSVYERTPVLLGMTPSAYRRGGRGVSIGYAIAESTLGYVLIAATERGVVAVRFAASEQELENALVGEFPEANLTREEEALGRWMTLLLSALQGQPSTQAVPFDIQGSAFQWKVWEALKAIPAGQTRSYSEIARTIGQPSAAHAVARACATNPVAILIPCHRVIRENGELGGYYWGVERKEKLLALESTATTRQQLIPARQRKAVLEIISGKDTGNTHES